MFDLKILKEKLVKFFANNRKIVFLVLVALILISVGVTYAVLRNVMTMESRIGVSS